MSTLPAPPLAGARPGAIPRRTDERAGLAASIGLLLAFWWLATGLIVALQRSVPIATVSLLAVTMLAAAGAWMLRASRDDTGRGGARRAMLGGALLWGWVAATFYGGWIVGPGPTAPVAEGGPTLALALQALAAMAHHEAAALGVIALAWWATRGSPNRVGLQVLLVFWSLHQLARLNVFLGVVNPASRFLPESLLWLSDFFGPQSNSPLLFVSIVALALLAAVVAWRVRGARDPASAHGRALISALLALGALEHLLLATRWDSPFWDVFLRLRG